MEEVITETKFLDLNLFYKGKVRDNYDLGDQILMVTTDRISAFDSVLGSGIPFKGKTLNSLSVFWFNKMKDIVDNHLITADVDEYPEAVQKYKDQLEGRSMLVKKTKPILVECVVRGYLAGSGWKSYQKDQSVCGIQLPDGLRESDRLPEPMFTPAIKAETGHDENISEKKSAEITGKDVTDFLKETSIKIYEKASKHAESAGIIIADTKFEFGFLGDEIILIDEILTPDSSRFWPKDDYEPGRSQNSFDKQYVRDYLVKSGWNKEPPGPPLPEDVILETSKKYREAYRLLTGNTLG
jgi:phosphoribosylaminoimidazole-succinocarboxamide synthase